MTEAATEPGNTFGFTPRPGDIGLAPGGGIAMTIVRWGTGLPRFKYGRFIRRSATYGHAAFCVGTHTVPSHSGRKAPSPDEVMIIEATPGGVVERNVSIGHFDWSTDGPFDVQLDEGDRREIQRLAHSMLGAGYDWPNIGKFLWRWWVPSFDGRPEPDDWDDETICSELCVWGWRSVGVKGFCEPARPGNVPPNDMKGCLGPHRPKTGKR